MRKKSVSRSSGMPGNVGSIFGGEYDDSFPNKIKQLNMIGEKLIKSVKATKVISYQLILEFEKSLCKLRDIGKIIIKTRHSDPSAKVYEFWELWNSIIRKINTDFVIHIKKMQQQMTKKFQDLKELLNSMDFYVSSSNSKKTSHLSIRVSSLSDQIYNIENKVNDVMQSKQMFDPNTINASIQQLKMMQESYSGDDEEILANRGYFMRFSALSSEIIRLLSDIRDDQSSRRDLVDSFLSEQNDLVKLIGNYTDIVKLELPSASHDRVSSPLKESMVHDLMNFGNNSTAQYENSRTGKCSTSTESSNKYKKLEQDVEATLDQHEGRQGSYQTLSKSNEYRKKEMYNVTNEIELLNNSLLILSEQEMNLDRQIDEATKKLKHYQSKHAEKEEVNCVAISNAELENEINQLKKENIILAQNYYGIEAELSHFLSKLSDEKKELYEQYHELSGIYLDKSNKLVKGQVKLTNLVSGMDKLENKCARECTAEVYNDMKLKCKDVHSKHLRLINELKHIAGKQFQCNSPHDISKDEPVIDEINNKIKEYMDLRKRVASSRIKARMNDLENKKYDFEIQLQAIRNKNSNDPIAEAQLEVDMIEKQIASMVSQYKSLEEQYSPLAISTLEKQSMCMTLQYYCTILDYKKENTSFDIDDYIDSTIKEIRSDIDKITEKYKYACEVSDKINSYLGTNDSTL